MQVVLLILQFQLFALMNLQVVVAMEQEKEQGQVVVVVGVDQLNQRYPRFFSKKILK